MKKLTAILLGTLIASSAALAQTNQVLSRNAVGYVKATAPATNGLTLLRIPFFSFGTNITQVMGGAMHGAAFPAQADQILKWRAGTNQSYVTYFKHNTGQWRKTTEAFESPDTLEPGESFWVLNRRVTNQFVYLMGEVPDQFSAPTFPVDIDPGLQLISYSYPIAIAITNLGLHTNAIKAAFPANADQIQMWVATSQTYRTYYAHSTAWRRTTESVATTDIVEPGEGMWYLRRGATSTIWNQTKPYTWP